MGWMRRVAGGVALAAGLAGAAEAAPIVREGGIRPPDAIVNGLGRLGIADGIQTVRGGGVTPDGQWIDWIRFGIDGRDGKQVNVTLGNGTDFFIDFDQPGNGVGAGLFGPDGHKIDLTRSRQVLQFATTVQRGQGLYVLQVRTDGFPTTGPGGYAIDVGVTPLPPAAALLAAPLLGLGWLARRRRRAAAQA